MKTEYKLTEGERERLTRTQMNSLQYIMHTLSSLRYGEKDLADRIICIPNGKRDYACVIWMMNRIVHDLLETVPDEQCKRMLNQTRDCEMRMVPKLTPPEYRMTLTKEEAMQIIDLMRVACQDCIKDVEECRSCACYKMLTALVPLESYDNIYSCPYSIANWEDR